MGGGQDSDDDDLPRFKPDASGILTPDQRDIGEGAKRKAEEGLLAYDQSFDPDNPAQPAQLAMHVLGDADDGGAGE